MTYYSFKYQLERGGNVSTVIGKNKDKVEKEHTEKQGAVVEGGTLIEGRNLCVEHALTDLQEHDVEWISVNSDYEPVQISGIIIGTGTGRKFYYYISKSKNVHLFVSTNREELEEGIEEVREQEGTEILTDGIRVRRGEYLSVETEYSPSLE